MPMTITIDETVVIDLTPISDLVILVAEMERREDGPFFKLGKRMAEECAAMNIQKSLEFESMPTHPDDIAELREAIKELYGLN